MMKSIVTLKSWLGGHLWSLEMGTFDRSHASSYSSSIVQGVPRSWKVTEFSETIF